MIAFAGVNVDPEGWVAWIVVGLIAGYLAGRVMGDGSYGLIVDIALGLVGSVLGGFLFGTTVGTGSLPGSIAVAFVGACLLIWVARVVSPGGRVRR